MFITIFKENGCFLVQIEVKKKACRSQMFPLYMNLSKKSGKKRFTSKNMPFDLKTDNSLTNLPLKSDLR